MREEARLTRFEASRPPPAALSHSSRLAGAGLGGRG